MLDTDARIARGLAALFNPVLYPGTNRLLQISQEELGYKSDLHYTHIGAIERGEKNWSIDTLVKVAKGLKVTVNDLLVLPSKPDEIKNMKKTIVAAVNGSSPEALKIFFDVVSGINSIETNLIIQKKQKK